MNKKLWSNKLRFYSIVSNSGKGKLLKPQLNFDCGKFQEAKRERERERERTRFRNVVMAACGFSSFAGGNCGSSKDNPGITCCVTLGNCHRDIKPHLQCCQGRDSSLTSELPVGSSWYVELL